MLQNCAQQKFLFSAAESHTRISDHALVGVTLVSHEHCGDKLLSLTLIVGWPETMVRSLCSHCIDKKNAPTPPSLDNHPQCSRQKQKEHPHTIPSTLRYTSGRLCPRHIHSQPHACLRKAAEPSHNPLPYIPRNSDLLCAALCRLSCKGSS